ncbi:MAG: hypothetical protein E5Y18_27495, partial [Mesorhizobium sp.]
FCLARNPLMSAICHKNRIDSILELVQFFARSQKGKGEHSMTINPKTPNPTTRKPLSVLKSHLHAVCAATALLLATGSVAQAADLNALIW